MKKLTVMLLISIWAGIVSANAQCCDNKVAELTQTDGSCTTQPEEDGVKAYYFHATRRCATCQAVESVTKEALKAYYGEKVPFQSINREEDNKNPLIEKYKVSGQTLLIVNGDKVVNLTNDAFLNARTNPEKYKAKLKSTIDSMK
ncbi:nitrophenyl compound nitroreductase subunit ArsF family protein [Gaoshiqia sediminis]|uniref:Nitrophenyl compound nitroreductase subunit ArsF family protein n=1 Tax=Gaoshiqia sediminis TaxID=2986998 RepID=A0AA42C5T4_9BACT|nr:nitrophenyl compound nitroreductase subunit ArsF family protein [Gaoshiqia sediminis]MCW0483198.1 nitrophenyl compound nitroreductase subunit ArsF family protein [Gaoshiqia sediminis]